MKPLLLRLTALFLIPVLVIDPALAGASNLVTPSPAFLTASTLYASEALEQPLANWSQLGLAHINRAAVRLWQSIRPKQILVKDPGGIIAIGTLLAVAAWSRFMIGPHWWSWRELLFAAAATWLSHVIAYEIFGYKALLDFPRGKRLATLWRIARLQARPHPRLASHDIDDAPMLTLISSAVLFCFVWIDLAFRDNFFGMFCIATFATMFSVIIDMFSVLPGTSQWFYKGGIDISFMSSPSKPAPSTVVVASSQVVAKPAEAAGTQPVSAASTALSGASVAKETEAVPESILPVSEPKVETPAEIPWLYTFEGVESIVRMGTRRQALSLNLLVAEATKRAVAPLPPDRNPRELHRTYEQLTSEENFWALGFTRAQLESFLRMALREKSAVYLTINPYPSDETKNGPPLELKVFYSFELQSVLDRVEAFGRAQMERSHELGQPYFLFTDAPAERDPLPPTLTVEPHDQTSIERHYRRRPPQLSVERIGPFEMESELEVEYAIDAGRQVFEWTEQEASLAEQYYRGDISLAQLREALKKAAHPRLAARLFNALNQVTSPNSAVEELDRDGKIAFHMLRGSLSPQQAEARFDKGLDLRLVEAQVIAVGVGVRYDIGPAGCFGIAADLSMQNTVNPPEDFVLATEAGYSEADVRKIMAEARDYQAGRLPKIELPPSGTEVKARLPYDIAKDFHLDEEFTLDMGKIPTGDELLAAIYHRYPVLRRFALVIDVNGRQQELDRPVSRAREAELRYVGTPASWEEVLRTNRPPRYHRYPWGLFLPGAIEKRESFFADPFETFRGPGDRQNPASDQSARSQGTLIVAMFIALVTLVWDGIVIDSQPSWMIHLPILLLVLGIFWVYQAIFHEGLGHGEFGRWRDGIWKMILNVLTMQARIPAGSDYLRGPNASLNGLYAALGFSMGAVGFLFDRDWNDLAHTHSLIEFLLVALVPTFAVVLASWLDLSERVPFSDASEQVHADRMRSVSGKNGFIRTLISIVVVTAVSSALLLTTVSGAFAQRYTSPRYSPYEDPLSPLNPASPVSPMNPANPLNPLNPLNPMSPFYNDDSSRRYEDDYWAEQRRRDEQAAQERWQEFIDGKNFIIAERHAGHDAAADARIAHLLNIALGQKPDFSAADRAYAQGALTLLSLEGSEVDRVKALNALLQIARTDSRWSNRVADSRKNLESLLRFMQGKADRARRAATVLRSASIPEEFIDVPLIQRLLVIDLRRQMGLGNHPASDETQAAEGVREVFRWNVLNREKGTRAALTVLYDPQTPRAQAGLLQEELVASGNEVPMRGDARARITFAPGLKRIDEERAAAAESERKIREEVHEKYRRENIHMMEFFVVCSVVMVLAESLDFWWDWAVLAFNSLFRRSRKTTMLLAFFALWHSGGSLRFSPNYFLRTGA